MSELECQLEHLVRQFGLRMVQWIIRALEPKLQEMPKTIEDIECLGMPCVESVTNQFGRIDPSVHIPWSEKVSIVVGFPFLRHGGISGERFYCCRIIAQVDDVDFLKVSGYVKHFQFMVVPQP